MAQLSDIASFVAVVEHGSISKAARAEGVPKSTISRRIARLEAELGLALVNRASQRIAITPDGRRLHALAHGPLTALTDAEAQLRDAQAEPHGVLVITAPHDIGRSLRFVHLLQAYRARCPGVQVEVRLETRYVDLVREGVDVAVRAHAQHVPGDPELRARTLMPATVAFYASAAYLAEHGTPTTVEALATHPIIVHGPAQRHGAALTDGQRSVPFTPERPALVANDFGLIRALVAQGAGIALMPAEWAEERHLPAIERVLPQWRTTFGRLSIVWPHGRFLPARVRIFIDMAAEALDLAR